MILDIVFGILVLLGIFRGLRRGFAGQIVYVGAIVLGVMFAGTLVQLGGIYVEPYLSRLDEGIRPAAMHWLAVVLITLCVWILGGIVLTRYRVKSIGVPTASGQDRLFGALAAAATNLVLVCLLVAGLEQLPEPVQKSEFLQTQMHQSLAVQWSHKIPVAAWITKVPEVQDLFAHTTAIAGHFRSNAPEDPSTKEIPEIIVPTPP